MKQSTGVGRLLVAVVLVWAVAGCGSAVEGAAEPASGQEGLFDPCTDIPDSALLQAGLDPSTEAKDIAGVEQPGWKICTWTEGWYFVVVMSNKYSLEDAKANVDFVGFDQVSVRTRNGLLFHSATDPNIDRCYFAFDVTQGSIWVVVDTKGGQEQEDSTCRVAGKYVASFDQNLPR